MDDLPRQKLTEIISRYGRDVANDPRRCEAFLKDFCPQPQHKWQINVLVYAIKETVPAELLGSSSGLPVEVLLSRLTKRLGDAQGCEEEKARWAVESWALALGVDLPAGSTTAAAAGTDAGSNPPPRKRRKKPAAQRGQATVSQDYNEAFKWYALKEIERSQPDSLPLAEPAVPLPKATDGQPNTVDGGPKIVRQKCPACGRGLKLAAGAAGRRLPCPGCKTLLVVSDDLRSLVTAEECDNLALPLGLWDDLELVDPDDPRCQN
jgi:ribosomal protein S27AE